MSNSGTIHTPSKNTPGHKLGMVSGHSARAAFLRGVSIYMLASIAQSLVPLMTLPLVARMLTVADFGTVEAVAVTNALVGVFCSAPAVGAFNFYYHKPDSRRDLGLALVAWYGGPGMLLTFSAVVGLTLLLPLNIPGIGRPMLVSGSVVLFVATQFIAAMTNVLRMSEQPARCATYGVLSTLTVSGSAALCSVSFQDNRVLAYLGGLLAASVVTAGFGFALARRAIDVQRAQVTDIPALVSQWQRFVVFGFPLIPGSIAEASLSYLDRLIIMRLAGPQALGEYAMAGRVAGTVTLAISGIVLALLPYTLRLIHSETSIAASRGIGDAWRYHSLLAMIFCCSLTASAPEVLRLIGGTSYNTASTVVPWLSLSISAYSFTHYTYLGTLKSEKTYLFSVSVIMGVAMIAMLPFAAHALLPQVRIVDSVSVSRLAGTLLVVLFSLGFSQRLYPLQLPTYRVGCQFALAVAFAAGLPLLRTPLGRFTSLLAVISLLVVVSTERSDWQRLRVLIAT